MARSLSQNRYRSTSTRKRRSKRKTKPKANIFMENFYHELNHESLIRTEREEASFFLYQASLRRTAKKRRTKKKEKMKDNVIA